MTSLALLRACLLCLVVHDQHLLPFSIQGLEDALAVVACQQFLEALCKQAELHCRFVTVLHRARTDSQTDSLQLFATRAEE